MSRSKESSPARSSSAKSSRKSEENDVFTALTTPAKLRNDYQQVGISISRAHMGILEAESNMYGLRKSQLLELLFLNAIGQQSLVRLPVAPQKYDLRRDELTETVKYLWYIRKEVKKLLDEFLVERGMKTSAWVVTAINDWVGLGREQKT